MSDLEKQTRAVFEAAHAGLATKRRGELRSASPDSMVEADMLEPQYAPPSSKHVKTEDHDAFAFIDDSFDIASFRGSAFESPADSQKTHGSYAKSSYCPSIIDLTTTSTKPLGKDYPSGSEYEEFNKLFGSPSPSSYAPSASNRHYQQATAQSEPDHGEVLCTTACAPNCWHDHHCDTGRGWGSKSVYSDTAYSQLGAYRAPPPSFSARSRQGWGSVSRSRRAAATSAKPSDEDIREVQECTGTTRRVAATYLEANDGVHAAVRAHLNSEVPAELRKARPNDDSVWETGKYRAWDSRSPLNEGGWHANSVKSRAPYRHSEAYSAPKQACSTIAADESTPTSQQQNTYIKADHQSLLNEIACLRQRLDMQAAVMQHYQHFAPQAYATHGLNAWCELPAMGAHSNVADNLHSCASNPYIPADQRNKALAILNDINSGIHHGAMPQHPSTTPAVSIKEPHVDLSRVETQIAAMSKDITKMKAYEKFQRMQQDSDRLVHVEEKLAGTKGNADAIMQPVTEDVKPMTEELSARVAYLEQVYRNGTTTDAVAHSHIQSLHHDLKTLHSRIERVQADQASAEEWLVTELAELKGRVNDMHVSNAKTKAQNDDVSETCSASSRWGGTGSRPRDAWGDTLVSPAKSFVSSGRYNPGGCVPGPTYASSSPSMPPSQLFEPRTSENRRPRANNGVIPTRPAPNHQIWTNDLLVSPRFTYAESVSDSWSPPKKTVRSSSIANSKPNNGWRSSSIHRSGSRETLGGESRYSFPSAKFLDSDDFVGW